MNEKRSARSIKTATRTECTEESGTELGYKVDYGVEKNHLRESERFIRLGKADWVTEYAKRPEDLFTETCTNEASLGATRERGAYSVVLNMIGKSEKVSDAECLISTCALSSDSSETTWRRGGFYEFTCNAGREIRKEFFDNTEVVVNADDASAAFFSGGSFADLVKSYLPQSKLTAMIPESEDGHVGVYVATHATDELKRMFPRSLSLGPSVLKRQSVYLKCNYNMKPFVFVPKSTDTEEEQAKKREK